MQSISLSPRLSEIEILKFLQTSFIIQFLVKNINEFFEIFCIFATAFGQSILLLYFWISNFCLSIEIRTLFIIFRKMRSKFSVMSVFILILSTTVMANRYKAFLQKCWQTATSGSSKLKSNLWIYLWIILLYSFFSGCFIKIL